MSASVTFQVKSIVESFSAKSAKISLDVAVTLHMSIQKPLQVETLGANSTLELGRIHVRSWWHSIAAASHGVDLGSQFTGQWILDAVSAVDQFDGSIGSQSQLQFN